MKDEGMKSRPSERGAVTDLPTRLRTEAAEHYRSGSKLWQCGIPEGSEMQACALLMRDAADEIEGMRITNRDLHRRMQAVEGPLLAKLKNAERAAAFWLARRQERGSEAVRQKRRANAAEAEVARLREGLAFPASSPIVKTEDGA